jgi:photosystem II stability/assembly factor-like uncharacterized protein
VTRCFSFASASYAQKVRAEVEGGLYHVITRGNNRQRIFNSNGNDWLVFDQQAQLRITQRERLHGSNANLLGTDGKGLVADIFAVWQTLDNGSSWHEVDDLSYAKHEGRVREMSFRDSKDGWAICDGGAMFRTNDGGNRWYRAKANLVFDRPAVLQTIKFVDENHGWWLSQMPPQPYPEKWFSSPRTAVRTGDNRRKSVIEFRFTTFPF